MIATFRSAMFVKVMMLVVAGAFIALIVLEWGADYSSTGKTTSNLVGVINDQEITYEGFDERLRYAYRLEKSRGTETPEISQLVQQEWDRLVSEILVAQEIQRHQIGVSDQEVNLFNRANPPAEIRNIEFFKTEGEFDLAKYHQFLDSPTTYADPNNKQIVLYAENRSREQLLSGKLQDLVAGSLQVTSPEVRDIFNQRKEKVRVEYAGLEVGRIPDSLVTVTDAEISAFYEAHADEFHQDEAVRAVFVTFAKLPTARDEALVQEEIQRVFEEVTTGSDFEQVASEVSEDPGSAQKGGDLGYFKRGQMVKVFEDSAFTLAPGTVSRPFRSQFGWHILKVEDRRGSADSLQVKARHILMRLQPGRETLDSLRLAAEDFVDQAREIGFDATAARAGLEASDTGYLSAGGFFPLLGNRITGLVRGFLDRKIGAVSTTYENDRGIYVFSLTNKRPAGPRPLEEVRNQVSARVRQDKKVASLAAQMEPVLADARNGASLAEAAERHKVRYAAPELFSRGDFVPIVGSRNAFIGAAFRLAQGTLSEVVRTRNGAYVLRVVEKTAPIEADFDVEKQAIKNKILTQKRNELLAAWFGDIRKKADIQDYRHRFYTEF